MKSGSSAFIFSGLQAVGTDFTSSWYQRSRPSAQSIWPPVRRTTSTFFTSVPALAAILIALSVLSLSGIGLPPRSPSSAVITKVELQSSMRPASDWGEKPPKTTECTAPIRAQASIA